MSSNTSSDPATATVAEHLLELALELVDQSTALSQVEAPRRARLTATLSDLGDALHAVHRHALGGADADYGRIGSLTQALLADLDGVLEAHILERQRKRLDPSAIPDRLRDELSGGAAAVLAAVENAAGEFAALGVGLSKAQAS